MDPLKYIAPNRKRLPYENMIESNIRIDYEKLRMLIRKDKEFAHDASIIQTLVSQGFITGDLQHGGAGTTLHLSAAPTRTP